MRFTVETDVAVPTADGTVLRSDVYRPDDDDRHPVLLCRTPYGKSGVLVSVGMMNAPILTWTARGYVVVVQDCRGTGRSDGDYRFYVDEASDGVDAIAWCATQSWSSGQVGMFGAPTSRAPSSRPPSCDRTPLRPSHRRSHRPVPMANSRTAAGRCVWRRASSGRSNGFSSNTAGNTAGARPAPQRCPLRSTCSNAHP